jgi:hypothetical protein
VLSLTVLGSAVLVSVIATEGDTSLVTIHQMIVPSSRLCGASVAEKLGIESGPAAQSLDMVTSVGGKSLRLSQSLTEQSSLGRVTGSVDRILVDGALGPIIGSWRLRV